MYNVINCHNNNCYTIEQRYLNKSYIHNNDDIMIINRFRYRWNILLFLHPAVCGHMIDHVTGHLMID